MSDMTATQLEPQTIPEFYAGRHIFITGGTGLMGKVLVEKLLRSCPDIDAIYLLIRPKGSKSAHDRLQDMLKSKLFEHLQRDMPSALQKIVPISGDIFLPEFGISQSEQRILFDNVSVVFHSAATVKFDEALRLSVDMNVLGVKKLVLLCHKMKKLEALIHVSTAYANCNREVITESIYPPPLEPKKLIDALEWMSDDMVQSITAKILGDWPNTYTFTKAMAENVLKEERGNLPLAIIRPSIVGASWREPVQGWVDSYNGPTGLLAAIGKGVLRTMKGKPSATADIMPVDVPINLMVAAAWYTAVNKPQNIHVYNCTSGQLNRLTWGAMEQASKSCWMKNPSNEIFRIPNPRFTQNSWSYTLKIFFDHLVPAYCFDMYNSMLGRRSNFKKLYRNLHKATSCLDYFTSHEWDFTSDNISMLMSQLHDEDKKTFNFDVSKIHWPSYMENYCLGTKKYVLKEDLADLPEARRKLKKFQLITTAANVFLAIILWRLIIARSALARKLWYFVINLALKLVKAMPMVTRS